MRKSVFHIIFSSFTIVLIFVFISCTGSKEIKGKYCHSAIPGDVWFEFDGKGNAEYTAYGEGTAYTYTIDGNLIEIKDEKGRTEYTGTVNSSKEVELDFHGMKVKFQK